MIHAGGNAKHHEVDWADLATLDLSTFDTPGGKERLAKQLFDAIEKIGKTLDTRSQ